MLRLEIFCGQIFLTCQINAKADQHAHARCAKAIMPAINFAERPDDQGGGDDACVNRQIKNLKVFGPIEGADLACDIALEHAASQNKAEQGEEEGRFKCHQKMAKRHGDRAKKDRPPFAQNTVGQKAAQYGRQIDKGGIGAEYCRGEGLSFQPAIKSGKGLKKGDVLDVAGQQQLLCHEQDEQRLHAVKGEAFPCFGKGQISQPFGMAQKCAIIGLDFNGHSGSPHFYSRQIRRSGRVMRV